ncbi:MAG: DMT family transporter [Candidatus Zixiibacteriota bacterium]
MLVRVYLLLAVIFWGWSFVATKILLSYVNPVELMGLRFIVGLPVLFVVVFARKVKFSFSPRHRWQVLLGAAIITAHFLIQITGIKYTTATNTGWIISITPLVLAVMSYLILREKIGYKEIAGIAVATAGILLLVSRGDITDLSWLSSVGDWLVLASAHTWALYTVATRDLSRKYDPLAVTSSILLPSAVILVTYMLFTSDWDKFLHLPFEAVLALLFLGVLSLAIAHWFWQEGVSSLGASRAGIFLYLEPLATTALAVPYLGEPFGVFTAVGGMLVLGGVYLAQTRTKVIG